MPEEIIKKYLESDDIEIKEIDEKKRVIWHKITKEVQDRLGDIVRIDGLDTTKFRKKPAVLYAHDYRGVDPVPVVAENIGFRKEGKALYAGTRFLNVDEVSPKLRDLINDLWLLNTKKLIGWSIGFIPKEQEDLKDKEGKTIGIDFKVSELLEYSNVIIPAHQDAINDAISKGIVSKDFIPDFQEESDLPGKVADKLIDDIVTKPSEENHVCILSKKDHDKYRSDKRKHEGKEYTIRYGRISGTDEWEEYEYFYAKDIWAATEARKHCKDHEGSFEAATGKCEECTISLEEDKQQGITPEIIDRLDALAEKRKQIRELISKILQEEKNE